MYSNRKYEYHENINEVKNKISRNVAHHEYLGRELLKKISNNSNIQFSYISDHFDAILFGKKNKYMIEIKCRSKKYNYKYSKFQSEGLFIEKPKYDFLIREYQKNGYIPIYINFLTDESGEYKKYVKYNLLEFPIENLKVEKVKIENCGRTYTEERVFLPFDLKMLKNIL